MAWWHDPRARGRVLQALALLAAVLFLGYTAHNVVLNLQRQGIASGFSFLDRRAGFSIIQHLLPFDEDATYGRAFAVALVNTLLVSVLGIFFATIIGFAVGIARLSHNFLVSRLALAYVESVRNLPLLLHIFIWYFAALRSLPDVRESYRIFDIVFLNMRGLYLPWPSLEGGFHWDVPIQSGFNFEGGVTVLPELIALVAALSIYTGAFIAEIVRGGLLAVSKGQWEAAEALGLSRRQTLRLVVVPQSMRVIIPPLTNQYLNLAKNSSLAAAIAYPDLVLVFAGTVLMQTGQAVEVIALTMGVYLLMSLGISLAMNAYNRRVAMVGQ